MIDTARPEPKARLLPDRMSLLGIHRFLQTRKTEASVTSAPAGEEGQLDLELAKNILARIESRLPGRLRHLTVYTTENAVILTGQCCTFYTKQLAQHIAMGVLEYEQLVNNIDVQVGE